jgi:hypothetical protein
VEKFVTKRDAVHLKRLVVDLSLEKQVLKEDALTQAISFRIPVLPIRLSSDQVG